MLLAGNSENIADSLINLVEELVYSSESDRR